MTTKKRIEARIRELEDEMVSFEKLRDKNRVGLNRSSVTYYNKIIAERTAEQTTLLKVLENRI